MLCLLYANHISIQAQTWKPLEYNQDQKGLAYNPLKGFTTLWNPSTIFRIVYGQDIWPG